MNNINLMCAYCRKYQFDGQCCKQRHVDAVHTVSKVGLMGLSCKQCAFDGSYSVNNVSLLSPYCKQRILMNPWCKQRKLNGSMLQETQV
jgi:hypothetical protein